MTAADHLRTPTREVDYYPDIIHHIVVSCKHATLSPYTQVRVKMATTISDLIHMERRNSLCTGRHVRPAKRFAEVVGTKPFEISLTHFSSVEKKLSKEIIVSYTTSNEVIQLNVTSDMATGL